MTAFGPQLIGETEKTLGALLQRVLAGSGLTEPQWVTLRLAAQIESSSDLVAFVADRAHFGNAMEIIANLTDRGLITNNGLTDAGRTLVADHHARIISLTAALWADLPADDIVATERLLNTVVTRGRDILADLADSR